MLSLEALILLMVTVFLLGTIGIIFVLLGFIFSVGLLLERQILCQFFKFHGYESTPDHNDDYHTQAKICKYCNKIKWK